MWADDGEIDLDPITEEREPIVFAPGPAPARRYSSASHHGGGGLRRAASVGSTLRKVPGAPPHRRHSFHPSSSVQRSLGRVAFHDVRDTSDFVRPPNNGGGRKRPSFTGVAPAGSRRHSSGGSFEHGRRHSAASSGTLRRHSSSAKFFVVLLCLILSVMEAAAFDIYWNSPSAGCLRCKNASDRTTPAASAGLRVNAGQAFTGTNATEIVVFYKFGVWPQLSADTAGIPCWVHDAPPCSWNPWVNYTVVANGGVPQRANLSLHLAQVARDLDTYLPDLNSSAVAIVDWEAWRIPASMNYDTLSLYVRFSQKLVREAHPTWTNATRIKEVAAAEFNAAGKQFFLETIKLAKKLRPNARFGYYQYPMDNPSVNDAQEWFWEAVDVLAPSVYIHTPRLPVVNQSAIIAKPVEEALRLAALVGQGTPSGARPVVMPYIRAGCYGVWHPPIPGEAPPFMWNTGDLVASVMAPASMGVDGLIMWGSSSDVHNCSDCGVVERWLAGPAGAAIKRCVADRQACAAARCSGHGKCVDYEPSDPMASCQYESDSDAPSCICDPGYTGSACASRVHATITTTAAAPIILWPNGAPGEVPGAVGPEKYVNEHYYNVSSPELYPFLVPNADAALVVAPGGGYRDLAWDKEGLATAAWLNSIGVSAFLLKYRVPARPAAGGLPPHWAPLQDAQRAMGVVRARAAAYGLNASRIGFAGFSAGSNLAAHLSTTGWRTRIYAPVDAADRLPCRPSFTVMNYLWDAIAANRSSLTPEFAVDADTPVSFLCQAEDDPVAPCENSLVYYMALRRNRVPSSEIHVYPHGGHGYGLCPKSEYEVCSWPARAATWMKKQLAIGNATIGGVLEEGPACTTADSETSGGDDLKVFAFHSHHAGETWKQFDYSVVTTVGASSDLTTTDSGLVAFVHAHGARVAQVVGCGYWLRGGVCVAEGTCPGDITSSASRAAWVAAVVANATAKGVDEISLDIEGHHCHDVVERRPYITKLVNETRLAFRAARPGGRVSFCSLVSRSKAFDTLALSEAADALVVMAYVYSLPAVNDSMTEFLALGVEPGKLVFAFAWYGRDVACVAGTDPRASARCRADATAGSVRSPHYADIVGTLLPQSTTGRVWDPETSSPFFSYLDGNRTRQVSYDDPSSLRLKYTAARSLSISGVGMWEADYLYPDQGDNGKAAQAMWDAFKLPK